MGADATNRQVYTTRIQSIKNRTHSIPILTMLELHFPLYTHFNRLVINNKWLMINEGGGGDGEGSNLARPNNPLGIASCVAVLPEGGSKREPNTRAVRCRHSCFQPAVPHPHENQHK